VTQRKLNRPDANASHCQTRSEGVPQIVPMEVQDARALVAGCFVEPVMRGDN
jgi:hypothetical protein